MKPIYKLTLAGLLLLFIISACSKKPDVEYTSTVNMSAEWFVEYYNDAAPTVVVHDFAKMFTYNTSDPSSNQIWVSDANFRSFKAKFPVDYSNLAFTPIDSILNTVGSRKIQVYEGKVLKSAAHSRSGNLVDSIYLKVAFATDPGKIYQIKGHQRTGFFEDEY